MKKVAYEEFLELVDLDALRLNEIEIKKYRRLVKYGDSYHSILLPAVFEFEDRENCQEIVTDKFSFSFWKRISATHLYIYDPED